MFIHPGALAAAAGCTASNYSQSAPLFASVVGLESGGNNFTLHYDPGDTGAAAALAPLSSLLALALACLWLRA